MITIEDCIALSELTEEEINAIAEHEHVPQIVACELGNYLIHTPDGCQQIRDDIAWAGSRGDFAHAATLKLVLKQFVEKHALQA